MNTTLALQGEPVQWPESASEVWHGRPWGYTVYRCRGPLCREAHRLSAADYRRRRKAAQQAADSAKAVAE
jgi:hypothetical protein